MSEAYMTIDVPELSLNGASHEPVADPPVSSRPARSAPPPLPESASMIPPSRAASDNAFAESMLERLAAGDYEGASLAAEALLEYRPRDQDALDCAQIAKSELRKVYAARLGSLDRVPHVAMGPDAIFSLQALDFRAGYLLSRVDGLASISAIIESGSLPSLEALRILSELFLRRVIAFDETMTVE
ncbi:MAG TPA: hypothetical protein VGG39_01970 [Polyangiaceae bacterium]|jgi:hypothetical protein